MGQNSPTPLGEQNSLLRETTTWTVDSHMIRSCALKLRQLSQPVSSKQFPHSFFKFWVGRYNEKLDDWFRGNQWVLLPLNVNVSRGFKHWRSRGNKTHCFSWDQALSAYFIHVHVSSSPRPIMTTGCYQRCLMSSLKWLWSCGFVGCKACELNFWALVKIKSVKKQPVWMCYFKAIFICWLLTCCVYLCTPQFYQLACWIIIKLLPWEAVLLLNLEDWYNVGVCTWINTVLLPR